MNEPEILEPGEIHPKVVAGGTASIAMTIILWVISLIWPHFDVPVLIQTSAVTLIGIIAAYVKSGNLKV